MQNQGFKQPHLPHPSWFTEREYIGGVVHGTSKESVGLIENVILIFSECNCSNAYSTLEVLSVTRERLGGML
jgi:hypothetical protein